MVPLRNKFSGARKAVQGFYIRGNSFKNFVLDWLEVGLLLIKQLFVNRGRAAGVLMFF